ncbi:hypothetical protein E2C01_099875 [Portunus trituberculatus]|uniref:Uncharacterized protein n=1 Tax=Portunus trituberculatus TaxID=210409 RepID=A0A5B7K4Y0_PORTR|nr:hypothetical protein [Portunus trituberculatus]
MVSVNTRGLCPASPRTPTLATLRPRTHTYCDGEARTHSRGSSGEGVVQSPVVKKAATQGRRPLSQSERRAAGWRVGSRKGPRYSQHCF